MDPAEEPSEEQHYGNSDLISEVTYTIWIISKGKLVNYHRDNGMSR